MVRQKILCLLRVHRSQKAVVPRRKPARLHPSRRPLRLTHLLLRQRLPPLPLRLLDSVTQGLNVLGSALILVLIWFTPEHSAPFIYFQF